MKAKLFINTLTVLASAVLPALASETIPLRGMSLADSTGSTDIDSANSSPLSGSQTPVQTIDSGSTESTIPDSPMQTIDSESTKSIEPEINKLAEQETAPTEPKKSKGERAAHFVTHLPQRLAFFTANVAVAAPATFVKRSTQDTVSDTKELVGDHKNPILLVPAGTLSLYYGLTSGLVEGATFGVINSWKHSADGHISKASLGLEEEQSEDTGK